MTTDEHKAISLRSEDRHLVDLLATVLVDPGIHTDTRLRLYHDIEQILRDAHEDLHGAAGPDLHRRALKVHEDWLPDVLASVLVDPNLHTDTRMRLHHEVGTILSGVDRQVWSRVSRQDYSPPKADLTARGRLGLIGLSPAKLVSSCSS